MGIFKAYDIRGRYPGEIQEETATRIGHGTAKVLGENKGQRSIAVGRDVRASAPSISAAVIGGITSAGYNVIDIGLCTTPMLYYAVGKLDLAGGIMVTASHNPPEWIGFKICREKAIPMGEGTGLEEVRTFSEQPPGNLSGKIQETRIVPEYRKHIRSFLEKVPPLKVVVDCANGAVAAHFDAVFGDLPLEFIRLCCTPDGSFPNHEPNPLLDKNVQDAAESVRKEKADLAVCFDGDGDRCMFLGPDGNRIPSDLVTALLARKELESNPGSAIVYDLRSSRVLPEEIRSAGGKPVRERVGHAFIKQTMRKHNAVFGGELSGHYYFRDHYFADSGMLAFAKVLDLLGKRSQPLEDLVAPLRRLHATGEMSFHIEDKKGMMNRMSELFADGEQDHMDGITIAYPDWWFNLRPSNTEPLLRLNLEADTPEKLESTRKQLCEYLGTPE